MSHMSEIQSSGLFKEAAYSGMADVRLQSQS